MEAQDSNYRKARLAEPAYKHDGKGCRMHDLPETIRPREYVERVGFDHAPPDVLLALLLRTGTQGINAVDLARSLLRKYGSLRSLASASISDLCSVKGISKVKAQILKAALALGNQLRDEERVSRPHLHRPEDVYALLETRTLALEHEVFWVLLLDRKNKLKCEPLDISSGILDASLVHPREVFREAIRSAAAAVIVAHNHPSGDPMASAEDIRITQQLIEAGKVIDIKVLDHVILGHDQPNHKNFQSLRESGLVTFA
jgi:DNA repair protein RadC